ncbi:MAG TPA: sigma-70 family RNA polymerase sigma factor [Stellaceae bacterium]|nr:sigma-70 family RNA polymerase sigma factor [Stellaceae bacterium]
MASDSAFAAVALPHLDAAYNLARWLTGSTDEAEEVVQEAMVRALTYFPSFRGANPRAWILQIVRNAAYSAVNARRAQRTVPIASDGEESAFVALADPGADPETALIRTRDKTQLDALLARLPIELRETLVLRELEELAYRDIARITGAPLGTVMSRLWRARRLLAEAARKGDRP